MPSAKSAIAHEQKLFFFEGASVKSNLISPSDTYSPAFQPSKMPELDSSTFLLSLDDLLADACDIASHQPLPQHLKRHSIASSPGEVSAAHSEPDFFIDYAPQFKKAKTSKSLMALNPNTHSISTADSSLNKCSLKNCGNSSLSCKKRARAGRVGAAVSSRRRVPAASSTETTSPARAPSDDSTTWTAATAPNSDSSTRPFSTSKKRACVFSSNDVYVAQEGTTDASVARYLASGRWNDLVLPSGPERDLVLTQAFCTLGLGGSTKAQPAPHVILDGGAKSIPLASESCHCGAPANEVCATDLARAHPMLNSTRGCSSNCIATAIYGILA